MQPTLAAPRVDRVTRYVEVAGQCTGPPFVQTKTNLASQAFASGQSQPFHKSTHHRTGEARRSFRRSKPRSVQTVGNFLGVEAFLVQRSELRGQLWVSGHLRVALHRPIQDLLLDDAAD